MRVLDTRITPGAHGPTTTRSYDMQAIDDATSASVAGFVMNVTATEGTSPTYLTVYPTGEPAPNASNLNVLPGENIPNLVVNKLGPGDQVAVFNLAGSRQLHLRRGRPRAGLIEPRWADRLIPVGPSCFPTVVPSAGHLAGDRTETSRA